MQIVVRSDFGEVVVITLVIATMELLAIMLLENVNVNLGLQEIG